MFLTELYKYQKNLQHKLYNFEDEDLAKMYGSATAAIIEIGEMLQTDTRWKALITGSKKEPVYNKEDFLEEYADVIIYLINVLVYANIDIEDVYVAINNKLLVNKKRFNIHETN